MLTSNVLAVLMAMLLALVGGAGIGAVNIGDASIGGANAAESFDADKAHLVAERKAADGIAEHKAADDTDDDGHAPSDGSYELFALGSFDQSDISTEITDALIAHTWESSPAEYGVMAFERVQNPDTGRLSYTSDLRIDIYMSVEDVGTGENVYGGYAKIFADDDAINFMVVNFGIDPSSVTRQIERISGTTDSEIHYIVIAFNRDSFVREGEELEIDPTWILFDGVYVVDDNMLNLVHGRTFNHCYWYRDDVPLEQRSSPFGRMLETMMSEDVVYTDEDGNVLDPDDLPGGQVFVGTSDDESPVDESPT